MSFSLPEDMDKRIAALAAEAHLSKQAYMLRLLERSLEDEEDYLKARAMSERIARGEEKVISYAEAIRRYESANAPN